MIVGGFPQTEEKNHGFRSHFQKTGVSFRRRIFGLDDEFLGRTGFGGSDGLPMLQHERQHKAM
jgi:hypothetical protein